MRNYSRLLLTQSKRENTYTIIIASLSIIKGAFLWDGPDLRQ